MHACFTRYFKFWRYFLQKGVRYSSYFSSCCSTSVFTSADIIFYNFSEIDWKLSKKRVHHKFPFLNGFNQSPWYPKSAMPDEIFLSMFPCLPLVNALLHHEHHAFQPRLLFWWKLGSYFQQGHQLCLHNQW